MDASRDAPVDSHAGDAAAPPACNDAGARIVNGAGCGCDADCQSGFCVDNVCCDSACGGMCKRCDVQGSMGTCSFVPAGLPARASAACSKSDVASCGTDGTCDGQGACREYVRGTVCKAGTCDGAALTGIEVCDGAGTCAPGDARICAPFSCDATKQDCFLACASNADCALGVQCVNGTCGLKMKGASCTKTEDCASGFCSDGVCCAVACTGACRSCNQTGRVGTCWPTDPGNPDPRGICKDRGPTKCGETGACDGFGSCAKYAAETVCVLPSCAGTRLNTPGTCDGQGTCEPSGVTDCAPFACAAGACSVTCATSADCAPGIACVNKSCGSSTNGGACTKAADCASGFCVDGVCCNEACGGACRSCALPSARGTCTPLAAGTLDAHNVCTDQGASSCGTNGRCDGAGGCAKYPPGTVCASETCVSNVYTGPPTCSATGQCTAPTSRACFPFACNGSKCFSACTTNANCVVPNVCNGNSCGEKLPGAPCSGNGECASNVCAQGFCCATTCSAACTSCGLPGSEGLCTNVPTGVVDPKAICVDQGAASCGTNGRCVAGGCQKYGAGTKCQDPTCPAGATTFTGQSTCDGGGKCTTPGATSCFPYACGAAACNATCKANADCAPNATCIDGSCGLEPKGGPCSATTQCAAGLVCSAQGVCCTATCAGPCVSCTLSATLGTCSPVGAGAPDSSGKCGVSAASTCGNDGKCDGQGACRRWQAGTQCAAPTCPAGASTATLATTCDGAGNCTVGGGPHACSPFVCDGGSACFVTCKTNADCVSPNTCVGNTCGKKPLGAPCATSDQCVAGSFCTDGFCCASSACGACKACNATGSCQNADGNACMITDKCHVSTGVCAGGACSSASIACDDNNPCTADSCDPASGCVHTPVANGTSCNDHNACTQTDVCQAGVCAGGNPVSCPGVTTCRAAQTCDPATGMCSGQSAADGTPCNDGNMCTTGEACGGGVCTGGTPKTCAASDQCHGAGACDVSSGKCSSPALPDGTPCNDGNRCTTGEACGGGVCTGGTPKTCTASDQCHNAGTCNPSDGTCSSPIKANGSPCSDGSACTTGDACQAGACVGTPKACGGADACHANGMCDLGTGNCSAPPALPDGTSCDDGNMCTTSDKCMAGACSGAAVTCTASDQCHGAGACDLGSGKCSNPALPDGTLCNDGNMCTTSDACIGGTCSGMPVVCADPTRTCNPKNGKCPGGM